jgi:hypothetical protein
LKTLIKLITFVGLFVYIGMASAAELFSDDWMKAYMDEWNKEPEIADKLAEKEFNSNIAYGFDGEEAPKGVLIVEKGKVTKAGACSEELKCDNLNWDLRATQEQWKEWLTAKEPMGMGGLGWAWTSRKLKFKVGNYSAMIKSPTTAGPFVKSFEVMGRVPTDWK